MGLTSRVAGENRLRRVFAIARLFQLKIGPAESGAPNGIRTRAAALKGRCPGPLDDGGKSQLARDIVAVRARASRSLVSREGIEPSTRGLKVPCSATELPARPLLDSSSKNPQYPRPPPKPVCAVASLSASLSEEK